MSPSDIREAFMTAPEAAKVLGITRNRVGRLCLDGRFDGALKMGREWIIPRSSVENHKRLPPGVKPKTPTRAEDAALLEAALGEAGVREPQKKGADDSANGA